MKQIKRLCAVLALLYALIIFSAAAFEVKEYGHDCCGEGCGICAVISICQNILKIGGGILKAALVAALAYIIVKASALAKEKTANGSTLISLKVRLDS